MSFKNTLKTLQVYMNIYRHRIIIVSKHKLPSLNRKARASFLDLQLGLTQLHAVSLVPLVTLHLAHNIQTVCQDPSYLHTSTHVCGGSAVPMASGLRGLCWNVWCFSDPGFPATDRI